MSKQKQQKQNLFYQKSSFAAVLKSSRKEKGWSQGDLSRQSHVSIRTIVDIEGGKQTNPRIDVIVRLASALEQKPTDWLRVAGHVGVGEDKVKEILETKEWRFDSEADPIEFFDTLKAQLKPEAPSLLCVAYASLPRTIHRPDIQQRLVDLINQGLWIAMVLPYPRVKEIAKSTKPNLAKHYQEIYGSVIAMAKELLRGVSIEKRKNLAVFSNRESEDTGKIRYAMPLAGLAEYRPVLIKRFHKNPSDLPKFELELAAWVTLARETKDRWLQVYPSSESDIRLRYDKLLCWRDYFSEILDNCDPFSSIGWEASRFDESDWQLLDLEPQC